ncbi:hypothetical protein Poli38472_008096 [Pythium oligandrum]|uniref:Uncharacterized protein n=1 Tax=Pythium oligandrum TaxID=41045 RepID=A0A8K1CL02_PYTOL|nr:hypothetical protein Poli38472_008096 [Pythium oligandrum]|eukprot:TMW65454.1 hypothetical protein Poli38472_008096 [Pythium oligandrum]
MPTNTHDSRAGLPWTNDEHDRFLRALELFPRGPWKSIAEHVGTRTTRQTMTHAQKYRQKMERQQKRKRKDAQMSSNKRRGFKPAIARKSMMDVAITTDYEPVSPTSVETHDVAPRPYKISDDTWHEASMMSFPSFVNMLHEPVDTCQSSAPATAIETELMSLFQPPQVSPSHLETPWALEETCDLLSESDWSLIFSV